jgi:hypothetical protein
MAVRLSALRTGCALFPRNIFCFWYSFLLEAEAEAQCGRKEEGRVVQNFNRVWSTHETSQVE